VFNDISTMFSADSKRFNERNDCTVRAFALVFNTTYDKAHAHLKNYCGRLNRKGISSKKVIPVSIKHHKYREGPYARDNTTTINQFVKKHPEGRYYVCVRGHALAIIDGIVYDHCHKPRRQIIWAMRVYLN
jgi:hypothetical protein